MENGRGFGELLAMYSTRVTQKRASQGNKQKLTQKELAQLVDVSRTTIKNWVLGYSNIQPFNMKKLIELFLHEGVFLKGKEEKEAEAFWESGNLNTAFDEEWFRSVLTDIEKKSRVSIPQEEKRIEGTFIAPPPPSHDIVGRSGLLMILKKQLFTKSNVAYSLKGLPGVGKTTLALLLAYDPEVLAHFSGGVLWAGLGRDATEDTVLIHLRLWGDALGISQTDLQNLKLESLTRLQIAIGQRKMLLIIDDVWKAKLADYLRIGGPHCAYILTTRLPEVATRFVPGHEIDVPELNEETGYLLLSTLAPEVVKAEPSKAHELVRSVGGLPLALTLLGNYLRIETQSGQPASLSIALERLKSIEERLKIEEEQGGLRSHPSLPKDTPLSLIAAIRISEEILTAECRNTLRAISLFPPKPNTFSGEAASAIASASTQTLHRLFASGLVERGSFGRFTLHQTIADYAKTILPEVSAVARMVVYYTNMVRDQNTNYQLLDQEARNIEVALELASTKNMREQYLSIVDDLFAFWKTRGQYKVAEHYVKQAQEIAQILGNDEKIINTFLFRGEIAQKLGAYVEATKFLQDGLILARDRGQTKLLSRILLILGRVTAQQGDFEQAEKLWKEGLSLAQTIQDDDLLSAFLTNLGVAESNRGNYAQEEQLYQEALVFARRAAIAERITGLLHNLGTIALNRGNYKQANDFFHEAFLLAQQIGHSERLIMLKEGLADVASHQGHFSQAETYFQEALQLAQETEQRASIATNLRNLGDIVQRRDYRFAEKYLREALALARQTNNMNVIIHSLQSLGEVVEQQGNVSEARLHLEEGLFLARELEDPKVLSSLLHSLGKWHIGQKNYSVAEHYSQEGLAFARQIDHTENTSLLLGNLGVIAGYQERDDQATEYLERALALAQHIQVPELICTILLLKGNFLKKKGKKNEADLVLRRALQQVPDGCMLLAAEVRYSLAQIAETNKNYREARKQGRLSLTTFENANAIKASEVRQWLDRLPKL